MALNPALRNFALTAHVSSSVGWFGAVAAFLGLAVAGLHGADAQRVRAAYIAMELTGWAVIVPFAIASLVTGLVESWTTNWGFFRHYWVVAKLFISVVATLLLLLHMQPASYLAAVAATMPLTADDLRGLRLQLLADAGAALLALLIATALSVYKPPGLTPYGRQRVKAVDFANGRVATAVWAYAAVLLAALLILAVALLHLTGNGIVRH